MSGKVAALAFAVFLAACGPGALAPAAKAELTGMAIANGDLEMGGKLVMMNAIALVQPLLPMPPGAE